MSSSLAFRVYRLFVVTTVMLAVGSGCQMIRETTRPEMAFDISDRSWSSDGEPAFEGVATSFTIGSDTPPREKSAAKQTCMVILGSADRVRESVSVELTGQDSVQSVLEGAGVLHRFRRVNIYVLRRSPQPGQPMQKMACNFSSLKGRVSLETDYAIWPGDRVYVAPEDTSPLDRMTGGLLTRLGSAKR